MSFEFKDLQLNQENNLITLLCFYRKNVSRYEDDLDYQDIFLMTFDVNKDSKNVTLKDKLYVISTYDDFSEFSITKTGSDNRMKFPLFDYYSYYWPQEKSLSASGQCVVYYTKEIEGMILSNVSNGDVRMLIQLNESFNENHFYYYNDNTGTISIVNEEDGVHQYHVDFSVNASGDEFKILNNKYNEAYAKKINLQKNDFKGEFKRVLFRALDAVETLIKKQSDC